MSTQITSLTAASNSAIVTIQPGESIKYSSSGTFTGDFAFRRSRTQGATWQDIERPAVNVNVAGATLKNETNAEERYRFELLDDNRTTPGTPIPVTGTVVTVIATGASIEEVIDAPAQPKHIVINAAGKSKAGTVAGWVVAAANNIALVTCPASQTASTLVVPVDDLKVGTKIVGFHLLGQVENTAAAALTLDADLRKHTAAAADVADASVAAMTQFTVAADAVLSATNTRKADIEEIVGVNETFYFLITATTGASVDIALQAVVLEVVEP